MKKKNLIILLIIPFIISALTIVTVNMSYNYIDVDISHIQWSYDDIEVFKIGSDPVKLEAVGVNNRNYQVSSGNDLVWKIRNKDESKEPCGEIEARGGSYYLTALSNGEAIVTCSNSKGNISRSFTAIMYVTGVAFVTPAVGQTAFEKIDSTNYFGQYDLARNDSTVSKTKASFDVQMTVIPASMTEAIQVEGDGVVTLDLNLKNATVSGNKAVVNGKAVVEDYGDLSINILSSLEGDELTFSNYSAKVVKDGINVYNFDDLMFCTNYSENGEIAVLQCSFLSTLEIGEKYESNQTSFGKQLSNGKIDTSFVKSISTEYNHKFLDQWNKATNDNTKKVSPSVYVALHVRKDFYGNGHMLNFHNVAYPSATTNGIPTLAPSDLFQGPLPFYTVGNPKGSIGSDLTNMNLISAYGQDNIGMYVDGDGIKVNDVIVKNCNDVNALEFLNTVGTVVEVHGEDVELRNMRMSNGRQVLRSFSNQRLTLNNCLFSNARNFLFVTGSNEYSAISENKIVRLKTATSTISTTLKDYLAPTGEGNKLLVDYLNGTAGTEQGIYKSKKDLKEALLALQDALTDESIKNVYKGSTEINDCYFYRSGVSAIGLESLFNGPFLMNPNSPDNIAPFFGLLNSTLTGVEFTPEKISGTSYPVTVNISGNTKFYDYKTWDELDVSGLISESISKLIKEYLGKDGYSIDNIFPIKQLLKGYPFKHTTEEGVEKVNIPIAFYGGGKNYSVVTTNSYEDEPMKKLNGATQNGALTATEIDILSAYLELKPLNPSNFGGGGAFGGLLENLQVDQNTLIKTVTLVTGYEPFRFAFVKDGYLCDKAPSIDEMKNNALSLGGNL